MISNSAIMDKFANYVNNALTPITGSKIIDGLLLKDVVLTTGSINSVPHRLNRELLGYIIVMKTATSDVWDSQNVNTFKNKTLNLNCSADVIVNLWVF